MTWLKLENARIEERYDVLECLGRGSYSEIYVARDTLAVDTSPPIVVMKALNVFLQGTPDHDLEQTLIDNFLNEAVALDRVRHPNCINRLGHGTALDLNGRSFHYLILEYMPGGDLSALCRNRPLNQDDALNYIEQICSGLAFAHQQGVIHRDLRPKNLLLSADLKTIKITDFGVAKLEHTAGEITRVGTDLYSAPEHNPVGLHGHTGEFSFLTPAADVYSLAKTVYMMVTGESPRRFSQKQITSLPESLQDNFWSSHLLDVLQKATELKPIDRYQSVESFWADIKLAFVPEAIPAQASAELIANATAQNEPETTPPLPHFDSLTERDVASPRPRIVVPIGRPEQSKYVYVSEPKKRRSRLAPMLILLLFFGSIGGVLFATHTYINRHWNIVSFVRGLLGSQVGKVGQTVTDVNLRGGPGAGSEKVGMVESGSRVRVLKVYNNWVEIEILQHGRPKEDPYSSDHGWINKKYIDFN
jgi:serine/threonine protein kinase